ncbi:citrate lyase holo-[acyl-carrier protein] synthase [Vibrio sp. 99-8-1]|uniref:citrate lyase holo-[acyl-carrier protein] synthase n=1 Tax=Vibrio sp. 99-8-1 TaxID=2607602 RepID=UPI001493B6B0|nr:citrate lyase holo-[acyl-carrier protein] synthase [Vibrio sp. 99-8-1]
MYSGPTISLQQLLTSREERAEKQRAWSRELAAPLVSFTINMVGPIKRNQIAKTAFDHGIHAIKDACVLHDIEIKRAQATDNDAGYQMLFCMANIEALYLKKIMLAIEETHPLGRLFDIDVIDSKGVLLSRDDFELVRRRCLICDEQAKVCARTQAHSLQQLIEKMSEMVNELDSK